MDFHPRRYSPYGIIPCYHEKSDGKESEKLRIVSIYLSSNSGKPVVQLLQVDKGGHWGMTKKSFKKTVSMLLAMAALVFAVFSVKPIGFTLDDGDEDDGFCICSVVEEDELL